MNRCKFCGNVVTFRKDPTGQRGWAWADESFPVTRADDRAFQCGLSPDGTRHVGVEGPAEEINSPAGFENDVAWVLSQMIDAVDDAPDIDCLINQTVEQISALAGFSKS